MGKAQHYAAVPQGEAAATAALQKSGTRPRTKAALEFRVIIECRSGEVQLAEWGEVNLESGIWTIPEDRVKTQRTPRVPLELRGIAIVHEVRELSGGEGLIFPSVTGKAFSDCARQSLEKGEDM